MPEHWNNWSGSQQHDLARYELPTDEAQLRSILQTASKNGQIVRTVGSGHSFVPFWTDDVIVSLDNMRGLIECDESTRSATFWAGTKLHEMGDVLWDHGLSIENMGDIDRQSIAGAISTGTHGTGATLSNIPSQLRALTIMKADGETVTLSQQSDAELFRAAQVSMGTLGIITKVTFELSPAYYLHEKNWNCSVDECDRQREALIKDNRHWEFFWDPASDTCAMKTLNLTEESSQRRIDDSQEVGRNYRILPSDREHKFNETEFSVPAEFGWECFMAIRQLMQTKFPEVKWPLEYRTLAADDMLISSASGRDSVTISAHQGSQYPHEAFFLEVENIFRRYQGRPHWGKVHSYKKLDLQKVYPQFDRFCEIRDQFDPEGRFLNPFLRGIFCDA